VSSWPCRRSAHEKKGHADLKKAVALTVAIALLSLYLLVLWMGLTEERRRSVTLTKSEATGADFVTLNIIIASVDPQQGLVNERIRLIPSGKFAIDKATPAVDLELLVNSVSGNQTVRFPRGVRIAPVDVTTLLTGEQSRYPFDRYEGNIDLMVSAPKLKAAPAEDVDDSPDPLDSNLIVGANYLDHSEPIEIVENFTASTPGIKFSGAVVPNGRNKRMRTSVVLHRANYVILVSMLAMMGMLGLAVSIMGMVVKMTVTPREINLIPLSLCVALIFGLPALRNIQPGIPPVGVLSDYISFIWAELIVSVSAIVLAWVWIGRQDGANP
jgi:hypothetical protein